MENQEVESFTIPEPCIEKLRASYKSYDSLLFEVDDLTVKHGFQVSKKNGDKKYIYLKCKRAGKPNNANIEKKKDKKSKKTG